MTTKLKIDSIVAKMKEGVKQVKAEAKSKPTFNPVIKPTDTIRVRDMRQDAMDGGSHGSEIFKEGQV